MTPRTLTVLLAAVVAAGLAVPVPTASAAPRVPVPHGSIAWKPCVDVARGWDESDRVTQCAELSVPLDHARPDGRHITVAISRRPATDPASRRGVLVVSPGGPGIANLDYPASFAAGGLRDLNRDHDLIGFDPRGVGRSERVDCTPADYPELPDDASEARTDAAAFATDAKTNRDCVAADRDLVAHLTPFDVAADLDSIRQALGERRIGYYGVSFGTAYGAAYRTLFDRHVSRMWLDSPLPPRFDLPAMDRDLETLGERGTTPFFAWIARHDDEFHLGRRTAAVRSELLALRDQLARAPRRVDGVWVDRSTVVGLLVASPSGWAGQADDLVVLRDAIAREPGRDHLRASGPVRRAAARDHGRTSRRPVLGLDDPAGSIDLIQYNAVFCQSSTGATSLAGLRTAKRERRATLPVTGGSTFTTWCADWPIRRTPRLLGGRGRSPLQISGHVDEGITPYVWAQRLSRSTGGTLLTVRDGVHGSLSRVPCGRRVITYFRQGAPANGSCPGID